MRFDLPVGPKLEQGTRPKKAALTKKGSESNVDKAGDKTGDKAGDKKGGDVKAAFGRVLERILEPTQAPSRSKIAGEKKSADSDSDNRQSEGETKDSGMNLDELIVVLATAASTGFQKLATTIESSKSTPESHGDPANDSGSRKFVPARALDLRQEFESATGSSDLAAATAPSNDSPSESSDAGPRGALRQAASESSDRQSASKHAVEVVSSPAEKKVSELLEKNLTSTPNLVDHAKVLPRTAGLARPMQTRSMQSAATAYARRESIRLERTEKGGRAELSLDVGDGQTVDLKLEVENGVTRVMMTTRSQELNGWMHRSADQLMRALLDAGLQLDGVDVDTSGEHQHNDRERSRERGEFGNSEQDAAVETVWIDALPSKIHIVA